MWLEHNLQVVVDRKSVGSRETDSSRPGIKMLSLVAFGEIESIIGGIHFSLPGAYHHAM